MALLGLRRIEVFPAQARGAAVKRAGISAIPAEGRRTTPSREKPSSPAPWSRCWRGGPARTSRLNAGGPWRGIDANGSGPSEPCARFDPRLAGRCRRPQPPRADSDPAVNRGERPRVGADPNRKDVGSETPNGPRRSHPGGGGSRGGSRRKVAGGTLSGEDRERTETEREAIASVAAGANPLPLADG